MFFLHLNFFVISNFKYNIGHLSYYSNFIDWSGSDGSILHPLIGTTNFIMCKVKLSIVYGISKWEVKPNHLLLFNIRWIILALSQDYSALSSDDLMGWASNLPDWVENAQLELIRLSTICYLCMISFIKKL